MLKVLDLFSGIGGFSLGLERTGGFETVAFCEIEEFPVRVLNKHWPDVPVYRDVRELTYDRLRSDGIAVDVITAGFPCQDISTAGKGAGIAEGTRSGLWFEVARIAGAARPRYIILENVAALLGRGLDIVLGDLAQIGYSAEWHCIPASAVGAPHRRDRWWCVAYAAGLRSQRRCNCNGLHSKARCQRSGESAGSHSGIGKDVAYPDSQRSNGRAAERRQDGREKPARNGNVAYPDSQRGCSRNAERQNAETARQPSSDSRRDTGGMAKRNAEPCVGLLADGLSAGLSRPGWLAEPEIGRIATGVPDRAKKLKALGNSIVPQIATLIGEAILETYEHD